MQESQWVVASRLERFPLIERQHCLCAVGDVEEPRLTACLIVESATVLAVDEGKTALPVHAKRAKHIAARFLDTNVKKVLMVQNPPPVTAEEEVWNTFKQLAEICETLTIPPEQYREIPAEAKPYFDQVTSLLERAGTREEEQEKEAQDSQLRSAPRVTKITYVIIRSPVTPMVEDRDQGRPHPTDLEPQDDPSVAQGTKPPEHGLPQASVRESTREPTSRERTGRRRGVVYEKTRSHYDRDYIQENAENVVGLVVEAAQTNDPALRQAAEQSLQSMHEIAEAVAKRKGSSLSKISRDKKIPLNTLSRWVIDGLVKPLYRDKKTIYIANETAEELDRIKQEAKETGEKPGTLLKERLNSSISRSIK